MRRLLGSAVALVLILSPAAALAGHGHHKHKHKKADLEVSAVQGLLSGRQLAVQLTVANKGTKKAGASSSSVYLSSDGVADPADPTLGALPVGALKPRKSVAVQGTLTVPESVPNGTYRIIACADATSAVKEKKEANNCLASSTTVNFVAPILARISFSKSGCCGSVTGQVTPASAGTCDASSCALTHVPATVVLTAMSGAGSNFTDWGGATCDGSREYGGADLSGTVTFTDVTTDKACVAGFFGG